MADLTKAGRPGGDSRGWTVGVIVDVNVATSRARVTIDGGEAELPFLPGTYTPGVTVSILRDPAQSGAGQLILGPLGTPPLPAPEAPPPPPGPPPRSTTVTAEALIRPVWSGTWRDIRGAYDRWNTDRYGGRSSLWQGSGYGSGPLLGIAVYGDQIVGLGAVSIDRVTLVANLAAYSGTPAFQGSPQSTRYPGRPTPTGDTVGGVGDVPLPTGMVEDLRTGRSKSLVTIGSDMLAVSGAGASMTLKVTYQKPA